MPAKIGELVSFTHQRCDTLVSDNERVVVTGNARSVGPSTLLSHSSTASSATLWQHFLHLLSALLLPGVGLHLCYVTYSTFMTGGPEKGGLREGGVVTPILCVYLCVHCTSAIYMCTPVLHGHADR